MSGLRQLDLLSYTPPLGRVADGATFEEKRDGKRLQTQLDKVFSLMRDGEYHTLYEIAEKVKSPTQSVSARLRDFRKGKILGAVLESLPPKKGGVWQYRLVLESVKVR